MGGENDSHDSSEVWHGESHGTEGDDEELEESHHHHHHHHHHHLKHKGAGTLVLNSLKNTQGYDEIVSSSNALRQDHGHKAHETYRQEYGRALQGWEQHHKKRTRSWEKIKTMNRKCWDSRH